MLDLSERLYMVVFYASSYDNYSPRYHNIVIIDYHFNKLN